MIVALFTAIGAVIGSFVALVSLRLPEGRPIGLARSQCGGCGVVLAPRDLVPLVSFAASRGRCRQCGVLIPWRYPAVETGAAAIGAVTAALIADPRAAAAVALLGWTLLLLALLDGEHFWLPSMITIPLAVAGLASTAWIMPDALVAHIIGTVAGFVSLAAVAAFYRVLRGRTGLGGGDARLFAASGAWLGWESLPIVLGGAATAGLIVALVLWRREINAATRLPFGVFLAAGTWIVALAQFG